MVRSDLAVSNVLDEGLFLHGTKADPALRLCRCADASPARALIPW